MHQSINHSSNQSINQIISHRINQWRILQNCANSPNIFWPKIVMVGYFSTRPLMRGEPVLDRTLLACLLCPWFSMVFHGFPIVFPWFSMVFHCFPWFSMVFHCVPWFFHGFSMVFHGFQWSSKVSHGLQWLSMVD